MKDTLVLRSTLIAVGRAFAVSLFLLLILSGLSLGQLTTYHINSAPDTPLSGQNQSDYDTWALSTSYPGSLMTGATVDLYWNVIDTGSYSSGCPDITTANWNAFDSTLSTIINSGKIINFLIMPVQEGGNNTDTPSYVFSQAWANNLGTGGCSGLGTGDVLAWVGGESVLPGNYIYAKGNYWQETAQPNANEFVGTCMTGGTEPNFTTLSSYPDGTCTWTKVGANAPPQDACFTPKNVNTNSGYPGDGVILADNGGNQGCFNINNLPGSSTWENLETGFTISPDGSEVGLHPLRTLGGRRIDAIHERNSLAVFQESFWRRPSLGRVDCLPFLHQRDDEIREHQ
jgi:hypothetical protein